MDGPEEAGGGLVAVAAALEDLAAVAVAAAAPAGGGKAFRMKEYVIEVSRIEELQTLNDREELERIFFKAHSSIVNGEPVILTRRDRNGSLQKFDELSTLEDLELYKTSVFKYL